MMIDMEHTLTPEDLGKTRKGNEPHRKRKFDRLLNPLMPRQEADRVPSNLKTRLQGRIDSRPS